MQTLKIGAFDQGHSDQELRTYLSKLHRHMSDSLRNKFQFRDNGKWFGIEPTGSNQVRELEEFLKKAGFMPFQEPNGIFDYFTLASLRLFQEYVRTVEKDASIGKPDGTAGPKTFEHIKRWKDQGLVADWGLKQVAQPTEAQKAKLNKQQAEYNRWLNLMKKAHEHFQQILHPIIELVENFSKESDTKKLKDWTFDPNDIHLVGIRRSQEDTSRTRVNDDIFVLLVNGMAFKFWGSTDPNQSMSDRNDEPFLVEGQHVFRFGWHKVSDPKKIYNALEPAGNGVLVFRDVDQDDALTDSDIQKGLEGPNDSINIHWSGVGSANFSAGCQVIAGKSYINHLDEVVDCSKFAATSYSGWESGLTMGAYNLLADLVLAYSPSFHLEGKANTLLYTLGRDDVLELDPSLGVAYAESILKRMNG